MVGTSRRNENGYGELIFFVAEDFFCDILCTSFERVGL